MAFLLEELRDEKRLDAFFSLAGEMLRSLLLVSAYSRMIGLLAVLAGAEAACGISA